MSVFEQNTMMCETEGYLEIILGPMFSGKTTRLVQIYNSYTYIGKKVVVVNYAEDKRYHDTMLSTHDHRMIECIMISDLYDAWFNTSNTHFRKIIEADVILINEGQFFAELCTVVLNMVDLFKKKVYICGLDGDFKKQKFGELLNLIPHCDKVEKLTALCSVCKNGKKALFSHRLTDEVDQVVIGSINYVPLCRNCYHVNAYV